jgi:hypothetical protein
LSIPYSVINDGDDAVIFVERKDLPLLEGLSSHSLKLGIKLTIEKPVYVLEEVEFCQCRPVFEGDGYIMVRSPVKALGKDTLTFKDVSTEERWNYQRASISQCGLALAGHLPVFSEFYRALGRGTNCKTDRSLESGMDWLARGMLARQNFYQLAEEQPELAARVRHSFFRAFNISETAQNILESYYRSIVPSFAPHVSRSMYPINHELTLIKL